MKIVRKSNAQATSSTVTDDEHSPPLVTTPHSGSRENNRAAVSARFKRANFSNMSRQELHDLVNCQTRSGQLSLEDSATFTWLSANVQIDEKAVSGELDQHEALDFLANARFGMDAALAAGNSTIARQFKIALDLMLEIQGQTIGVDTLV
ncbi:hypothetical protein [Granulosicoccus antarcticus]|nr:hypothetical protein [Granulosicoccus antarcticus]